MKFLIHSNGPTVLTGYGVQTAMLTDRLASDGHQVAISATFGQDQGVAAWQSPSGHRIRVYPRGYAVSGDDIIAGHVEHWFDHRPRDGWIIPLIDVWSLKHPLFSDWNVAAWTPVDHDPVPPAVVEFFERTRSIPVAMSRFGEATLRQAGLEPEYVPLAVDTKVYRPTYQVNNRSAREFFDLPANAFVVGMVAMNKDPMRKGFDIAFRAFAEFQRQHSDAILWLHTEQAGLAGGPNLVKLAAACGIPEASLRFSDQYAYRLGFPPPIMAALYTCFDVLLAPSGGEGFCVPLVEAQACGVPVIASNFTAQPELVGAGWLIDGERLWDAGSDAWYFRPNVDETVWRLEQAYSADLEAMQDAAVQFAAQYDADYVYATYWRPLLARLNSEPPADKPLMTDVAVLVPAMSRPQNVAALVESFNRSNDGTANLYYVVDGDDSEQIAAVKDAGATYLVSDRGSSFACKLNSGVAQTTESFVFATGDDVEFTPSWLAAARKVSDRYDVIGSNDAYIGEVRNERVAVGDHADHFFVRRSYIEDEGACLDGPGVFAPEAYFHYYTDVEVVQLAKARGVFTPCMDCRVIHHQPRYEGHPEDWEADPVYVKGGEFGEKDLVTFRRRAQLIDQQKVVKGNIW